MDTLTLDQIRETAPSVFADEPHEKVSNKYEFIPTERVLVALMDQGFQPVRAIQTNTRKEARKNFTQHELRFRHPDMMKNLKEIGDEVPEIVLYNSHDGSASYRLSMGLFRLACLNGMIVASSTVQEVHVRHRGAVVQEVIDASYKIVEEAPNVMTQIGDWKHLIMNPKQQIGFAKKALEFRVTNLDIPIKELVIHRRVEDEPLENGDRDLWKTMNVVQENLMRGGIQGKNADTKMRQMPPVSSIVRGQRMNRNIWELADTTYERLSD